jgi:hypothetical protein
MKQINTLVRLLLPVVAFTAIVVSANAQSGVTQVYSDYNGFWSSTTASNNAVHPDSSHNLLAFTYSGTTYSTGVNDLKLTLNAVSFTALDFASFNTPTGSITGNSGSTYIGVGYNYGGGGNVTPLPVTNDIAEYLTDGTNGLNLGTGIFNIPVTKISYPVSGFSLGTIGDGIPDVMLTQIGDPPPSSSFDTLYFADVNGNVVGTIQVGNVGSIPIVAQTNWKFYTPTNPPVYTTVGGLSRDLRIVGFDLQDFGLTTINLLSITTFVHKTSGSSDQAFLAHNTASFTSGSGIVLPIALQSFDAVKSGNTSVLNWTTADAKNFAHFEVERSTNNANTFTSINTVAYKNEAGIVKYTYTDKSPAAGINLYRLKMINIDGTFAYSKINSLQFSMADAIEMYPNPVSKFLNLTLPKDIDEVTLYSIDGKQIPIFISNIHQERGIDMSSLSADTYTLHIVSGNEVVVKKFQVIH